MEKKEGEEGGGIEFENFHRYSCLRAMETGDISIIRKRVPRIDFFFLVYLSPTLTHFSSIISSKEI